jgi:hypothetical protein
LVRRAVAVARDRDRGSLRHCRVGPGCVLTRCDAPRTHHPRRRHRTGRTAPTEHGKPPPPVRPAPRRRRRASRRYSVSPPSTNGGSRLESPAAMRAPRTRYAYRCVSSGCSSPSSSASRPR